MYIVACQAHPALVKIGPVLAPSFLKHTPPRCGSEVWQFDGDPAPLARDNILENQSSWCAKFLLFFQL